MAENNFDAQLLGEKIVKVLKTIFDPEIPVDIYMNWALFMMSL